jgi:hypothetical protein
MEKLSNFYQFFRIVLLQIHFGSGAARIRNEFFRIRIQISILLKVSDPNPQHFLLAYLSL